MKFVLFIAAMCVQTIAFAEAPTPVPLTPGPGGPIMGGHGGPQRSPIYSSICPIETYLSETEGTLEFVLSGDAADVVYSVYDEEGALIQTEAILFDGDTVTVDVSMLNAGEYYLQVVINGVSYSGSLVLQ